MQKAIGSSLGNDTLRRLLFASAERQTIVKSTATAMYRKIFRATLTFVYLFRV